MSRARTPRREVQRFTQEVQAADRERSAAELVLQHRTLWSRFKSAVSSNAFKMTMAALVPAAVVFALGKSFTPSELNLLMDAGALTGAAVLDTIANNEYWATPQYVEVLAEWLQRNVTLAMTGVRKRPSKEYRKKSASRKSMERRKSASIRSGK